MVRLMSTNSFCVTPRTKITGKKMATLVKVAADTVVFKSWLPSSTASRMLFPCSRSREKFSTMMMALSPSMPMPRASPVSEMMLKVMPLKYIITMVVRMENGVTMPMIRG